MIPPADSSVLRSPKRQAPRYVALAEAICARIASGEFPAGSQLPPERELARDNGVAYLTARQAVGLLVKKGIIARRHGHGTFVRSANRKEMLALLCGPDLQNESAHFYRAMVRALEAEGAGRNCDFRLYSGFTDGQGLLRPEENPVRRSFRADLANYSFDGLIEISPGRQGLWRDTKELPAPRVVYEPGDASSDVEFDLHDFGKSAIRHLAERGRRRIAIVRFAVDDFEHAGVLEGAFDAVAELGISDLKVRVIQMPVRRVEFERSIHAEMLELLRSWAAKGRTAPEGLIIGDDIAMRSVALALIQSGFASTHPLSIVCQACEGIEHHYGLPVSRYELQIGKAAAALLDLLTARIEGREAAKQPIVIQGTLKPDVV